MKTAGSIFCWLELLGLSLWIGGMLTLGALVAPTVFGELKSQIGGDVMSLIFRKFNGGLVYVCIILVTGGFIGKFLLDYRKDRSRWIEGGLLLIMVTTGLYIGAVLGPNMQELRKTKIEDPSNTAAVVGFNRGHDVSRNLFTMNLVLGACVLFLNGREIVRRSES